MGRITVNDKAAPLTRAVQAFIVGRKDDRRGLCPHRHQLATAGNHQIGEGARLAEHINASFDSERNVADGRPVRKCTIAICFQLTVTISYGHATFH